MHTIVAQSRLNVISTAEDTPKVKKNTGEGAVTFGCLRQVVIRKGFLAEVAFQAVLKKGNLSMVLYTNENTYLSPLISFRPGQ